MPPHPKTLGQNSRYQNPNTIFMRELLMKKKFGLIALSSVFILTVACFCPAAAASLPKDLPSESVTLDGREIPLEKLFRDENNQIFIGLDHLAELLGLSARHSGPSGIVILENKAHSLKLQVDNNLAIIDERWKYMKAPVQKIDGTVIGPLMELASFLGSRAVYRGLVPVESASRQAELFKFPPEAPAGERGAMAPGAPAGSGSSEAPHPEGSRPSEDPGVATPPERAESQSAARGRTTADYQDAGKRTVAYNGDSGHVYGSGRKSRTAAFGRKGARPRAEKNPWSMKGKVGMGFSLGAYRPNGGDIENYIESHLLWGGRFAGGISNHWSVEAIIEDWEDSRTDSFFNDFPFKGSGKLTVQPATFSLKCHFMKESPFKPYIGIGYSRFNVGFSFADNVNPSFSGKETCWGPSLQAGGEYFFSPHVSAYGGFRYHWARVGFDIKPILEFIEVRLHDFYFSGGMNFWFR